MQKLNVLRNAYMRRFFILNYQYNFSYCHFLTMHICFVKRPPHSKYCKKEINVYTRKTFFQFAYNFDLCKRRQNCLHDLQTRIAWNSSVWDVFSRLVVRCRHIYFMYSNDGKCICLEWYFSIRHDFQSYLTMRVRQDNVNRLIASKSWI